MTNDTQLSAFEESDDLSDAEWEEYRTLLQEKYRFYIMNPPYQRGAEYTLWIQEDEFEYPILSSNTGGFATFSSRDTTVGEGIRPTEEFLTLLGTAVHEAMCRMPSLYFRSDDFSKTSFRVYDDKRREYEVWAAHVLVGLITSGGTHIPELDSLAIWASKHTEFGIPYLNEIGDDE